MSLVEQVGVLTSAFTRSSSFHATLASDGPLKM
jgi:hypothetical protein